MNQKLTEEIAYHIFASLGVLPSTFVDQQVTKSIVDKKFLLSEKLVFNTEEGQITKSIYGCQFSTAGSKDLRLLLGDCTKDKSLPEYCLLVQLKGAPAFGVYLIFNKLVEDPPESEVLIGVNTDKKFWMPCTIYLQATFLAGMEQLKDLNTGWAKCTSYKDQHEQLLSFIKFHDNYFGGFDEGQEE